MEPAVHVSEEELEHPRRSVRAVICQDCFKRPKAESFSVDDPASRERTCPLFAGLRRLYEETRCGDLMLTSARHMALLHIQEHCMSPESRSNDRPLWRYRRQLARTLSQLCEQESSHTRESSWLRDESSSF